MSVLSSTVLLVFILVFLPSLSIVLIYVPPSRLLNLLFCFFGGFVRLGQINSLNSTWQLQFLLFSVWRFWITEPQISAFRFQENKWIRKQRRHFCSDNQASSMKWNISQGYQFCLMCHTVIARVCVCVWNLASANCWYDTLRLSAVIIWQAVCGW